MLTSGVPPESSLLAIKALVPGDSGGNTAFSDEALRRGTTGCGGEMVERYRMSICMISLKLGRSFGSSFQHEVTTRANSSGRSSALGLVF